MFKTIMQFYHDTIEDEGLFQINLTGILVALLLLFFLAGYASAASRDELLIQWGKLSQQKQSLQEQVDVVEYKMLKVAQEMKKLETVEIKTNEKKPADKPADPASGR